MNITSKNFWRRALFLLAGLYALQLVFCWCWLRMPTSAQQGENYRLAAYSEPAMPWFPGLGLLTTLLNSCALGDGRVEFEYTNWPEAFRFSFPMEYPDCDVTNMEVSFREDGSISLRSRSIEGWELFIIKHNISL